MMSKPRLIGHVCLGYSQYFQGDFEAGRQSVEHSWELHDKVKDRPPHHYVPQHPGLAGLNFLGPVRWSLGDQAGGIQAWESSHVLAGSLESRRALNLARIGQTDAWLHQLRRDYQKALDAAEQALAVAREYHFDWAIVNLLIHKGLAMAHLDPQGKGMQEGVALVNENLRYWRAAGAETMVPYFLGELGEAHHRAGDHAGGFDLRERGHRAGRAVIGEHCHDAALYRVRGQARLAVNDRANGIEDLIGAVALSREQRAVPFEIRSTVSLVTVGSEISHHEGWIERLEDALRRLETSENSTDERAARALIARERQSGAHASE